MVFWAVDKVIIAYVAFTTALILGWWRAIPEAPLYLCLHIAAISVLLLQIRSSSRFSMVFRHWYPLLYVAACYREMAILITAIRGPGAIKDRAMAAADYWIWHANPTVWLEGFPNPALTEALQFAYSLFIPAVLFVAYLLWRRKDYRAFRYYAFLIAVGFLVSYLGYMAVPVRGPRYFFAGLHLAPLRGLWLFTRLQGFLDSLESAHYDCFPSGHTELTMLACWGSHLVSRRLFRVYCFYTPTIFFATVYLRYHYSVDVFAGAATALILIAATPVVYKILARGAEEWEVSTLLRSGTKGC